jgi:hypothetical protein
MLATAMTGLERSGAMPTHGLVGPQSLALAHDDYRHTGNINEQARTHLGQLRLVAKILPMTTKDRFALAPRHVGITVDLGRQARGLCKALERSLKIIHPD